jgi:type IV pilus assembly protein PilF
MTRGALLVTLLLLGPLVGCSSTNSGTSSVLSKKPEPPAGSQEGRALERAKIHTQLGVGYYENGRFGTALEELTIAINADRTYAPAYNARALVYLDLKQYPEAEADFKQALKLDPNGSNAKNNYGLFLCQRGRGEEGIKYIVDAVRDPLYETPDVAWKNAGLCARKMGDAKEAEQYFTRALQVNRNQPESLYALAELRYARGDLYGARDFLNRYMKVVPNPGIEELWLGARLERRLGDRTAMLNYGNQLRRRFPGAPETKSFMEGRFE